MAQSLKARFEQIAADQVRDPNIEVKETIETIEHRTEKPVLGSGWGHSGNSGGGHTGHDGKFKPNKMTVEVQVETKVHREETRKGPPPKESLTDLP